MMIIIIIVGSIVFIWETFIERFVTLQISDRRTVMCGVDGYRYKQSGVSWAVSIRDLQHQEN